MNRLFAQCKKLVKKYRQFILYSIIGASGATLDFLLFLVLYNTLGVNPLIATILSVSAGIINNFFWNAHYNFKMTDHWIKRFLSFYFVGFLGVLLSVVIIYILHDGSGMSANLAKLISIPIIVIAQYLLNRSYAFGDKKLQLKYHRHINYGLCALNIVALVIIAFFIKNIPLPSLPPANATVVDISKLAPQAPDENAHFNYNTKFIIENHRLPVAGKDDWRPMHSCHNNQLGKVPCQYSYNVYPAIPYIFGAITAILSHNLLHTTYEVGARLPGLLYGLVFLNFSYLAIYKVTRRRSVALLLGGAATFIPQVIFSFSYLNLDGFSLAISAVLAYSFIRYLLSKDRRSTLWLAISAGGLLPLAKYNYFVLLIPIVLVVIHEVYNKRISAKQLKLLLLLSIASFIVLASFWYIRNTVLYHDPLGQTYVLNEMAKYHSLGTPIPFAISSFIMLLKMGFYWILFKSFFVTYGSMSYYLDETIYTLIALGVFALLFYVINRVWALHNRTMWKVFGLSFITFFATFCLVIYNSFVYDYQPQGRYMFPILLPFALFFGYLATKDRVSRHIPYILFATIGYIFILSLSLFIRTYL